jgi:hypothetical protein
VRDGAVAAQAIVRLQEHRALKLPCDTPKVLEAKREIPDDGLETADNNPKQERGFLSAPATSSSTP